MVHPDRLPTRGRWLVLGDRRGRARPAPAPASGCNGRPSPTVPPGRHPCRARWRRGVPRHALVPPHHHRCQPGQPALGPIPGHGGTHIGGYQVVRVAAFRASHRCSRSDIGRRCRGRRRRLETSRVSGHGRRRLRDDSGRPRRAGEPDGPLPAGDQLLPGAVVAPIERASAACRRSSGRSSGNGNTKER